MMIRSSSSVFPEVFVLTTCITSEKMLRAARSLIANQHERSNSVELMLLAISIVPAMQVIFFCRQTESNMSIPANMFPSDYVFLSTADAKD